MNDELTRIIQEAGKIGGNITETIERAKARAKGMVPQAEYDSTRIQLEEAKKCVEAALEENQRLKACANAQSEADRREIEALRAESTSKNTQNATLAGKVRSLEASVSGIREAKDREIRDVNIAALDAQRTYDEGRRTIETGISDAVQYAHSGQIPASIPASLQIIYTVIESLRTRAQQGAESSARASEFAAENGGLRTELNSTKSQLGTKQQDYDNAVKAAQALLEQYRQLQIYVIESLGEVGGPAQ